jgi:hypothetical protein
LSEREITGSFQFVDWKIVVKMLAEIGDIARRDPDFHCEDGNIVLSAKDENCTVYFRLHKSILAQNSPVFADMFSIPSPPTVDQYDGVD